MLMDGKQGSPADGNLARGLEKFRDQWKAELNRESTSSLTDNLPDESLSIPVKKDKDNGAGAAPVVESPYAFQYTDNLLNTWQNPLPFQLDREKRSLDDENTVTKTKKPRRSLVDVFLDDLNDIDEIPFFDISLPREIVLRIFSCLTYKDLCSCAQVSKAWQAMSEDHILWEKLHSRLRSSKAYSSTLHSNLTWKGRLKKLILDRKNLLSNWKEHKCETKHFQYARGGVITSADYDEHTLISGYSGGQIKTWNISSDETQTFECESKALQLIEEDNEESLGQSINCVTCVKSSQGDIVAGYKHGQVQLWRSAEQDKMSSAEFNGYRIQDVDLHDSLVYTQLTHRTGRQCLIKVLDTDADLKVVDTISIRGADEKYSLPKKIFTTMQHSASDNTSAIVYLSRDSVNLACLSRDIYNSSQISVSQTQLEQFVATHFTCLGASHCYLHIGLTSHLGIHAEYKVRCYDIRSMKPMFDLRSHTSQVTCVDNTYESGNLISTGCHDRRVRLYDTRLADYTPVQTFIGHAGAVTCVQCDDYKVVSGDEEGYVCVWDQRTGNKLWESQSSHPVKYLRFTHEYLISANIPRDTADYVDDDGMTQLRFRGRLQVSDFSVTQEALQHKQYQSLIV